MNSQELFNHLTKKFEGQAEIVSATVHDHFGYPTGTKLNRTIAITVFYRINGNMTNSDGNNWKDTDFEVALYDLERSILNTIRESQKVEA